MKKEGPKEKKAGEGAQTMCKEKVKNERTESTRPITGQGTEGKMEGEGERRKREMERGERGR